MMNDAPFNGGMIPMRIVIGNLPDDVTEEGIRTALSAFAPVEKIKLAKESGTPSALIEVETTRAQAEALAKRIHGRMYQGRALNAWVPLMDW
jgi:RNA recognition motif-containing protein